MVDNFTSNCFYYHPPQERFDFIHFRQEVDHIDSTLIIVAKTFTELKLETEKNIGAKLQIIFLKSRCNLLRKEKKIAVFGIFKAGKSTLINAILNQKILPSRTNRATGVITSIGYDFQQYAKVVFESREGERSKIVSLDKIQEYILLDISNTVAKQPKNIKTVEIKLPSFFLPEDCYLIDTPGLDDDKSLTELSCSEIKKSDCVIVALRADKLLSQNERETIKDVNNWLGGNVIFVMNRMGIIWDDDEEEEEENKKQEEKLLKLANKTLEGCGNTLIGKSLIIPTDALSVLKNDTSTRGIIHQKGVNDLKLTLSKLLDSFLAERLILLARIGITIYESKNIINHCQLRLDLLQRKIIELEDMANKDWENRKIAFSKDVESIRLNLDKEKNSLFSDLKFIIKTIIFKAKLIIDKDDTRWANKVNEEWKKANKAFVDNLQARIKNIVNDYRIKIPSNYDILISELNLSHDFGSNVTNFVGGSLALKVVRQIGNVVLNSNWREEHLNEVKKNIYQQQEQLLKGLENYFGGLEENVRIYQLKYQPTLEKSTELLAHYSDAKTYTKIISQLQQLLEFMIKITQEVKDWNKQFEIVWQPFTIKIINSFSSEYPQKLKIIKSNKDLNSYINDIVKYYLRMWQDEKEDQCIWLEILIKQYPMIGHEFFNDLNKMEINTQFTPVFLWSRKEIMALISSFIVGIIILLWGQDSNNFKPDLITLKQVMISFSFVYTVFSIVKSIKEKRVEKELSSLIKNLTSQIDIYHEKLGAIIKTIK